MNKISQILFLALVVGLFASCEESKGAAFVYGTIEISPGGRATFEGSLAESSTSKHYGYCEMDGDKFNFTVGHTNSKDLNQVFLKEGIAAYVSIAGVEGPPSEGVFDLTDPNDRTPDPKNDEKLETKFDSAVVKTVDDEWNLQASEAVCAVELFATPLEGEVIWENDLNKTFDYYVRLDCYSIPETGLNGSELNSFNIELYFENCN
ncbi:MAG: hypothetical protein JXX14_01810 [Deltaproteobacteria bacterium]|nr:hypothetical protein [Deltaproteobacteria bacterium]